MSKILLNGLPYQKNGAGISKYTQMLTKQFIAQNYDVDILLRDEFRSEYILPNILFPNHQINSSKDRIIYEQVKANKMYKNYDLVHFPDYATPTLYRGAKVATIHDMAMHTMRDKYTFMQNATKNILLKNTIKHADKLICVSQFSKQELLKYYPSAKDRAVVIYEGVQEPILYPSSDQIQNTLDKFKLCPGKYILYVGTIAPHKNILKLIQAFNRIKNNLPQYKLVIAGKKGWMYKDIFAKLVDLKLEKKVVFTDFVDDLDLEVLYANATMFVSTSLYEGFGFPPLEAMIRKLPVLVSDIEIFQETCQDSVAYCKPNEIEDISSKMLNIIQDKSLKSDMIVKGAQRAKFFSWEKTAKETFKVYQNTLR